MKIEPPNVSKLNVIGKRVQETKTPARLHDRRTTLLPPIPLHTRALRLTQLLRTELPMPGSESPPWHNLSSSLYAIFTHPVRKWFAEVLAWHSSRVVKDSGLYADAGAIFRRITVLSPTRW